MRTGRPARFVVPGRLRRAAFGCVVATLGPGTCPPACRLRFADRGTSARRLLTAYHAAQPGGTCFLSLALIPLRRPLVLSEPTGFSQTPTGTSVAATDFSHAPTGASPAVILPVSGHSPTADPPTATARGSTGAAGEGRRSGRRSRTGDQLAWSRRGAHWAISCSWRTSW